MSSLQSRTSQIASGRKPSFGCSNAQERSPSEAGYSEGSLPSDSETDDDSGYQLEDLDDPLECTFKASVATVQVIRISFISPLGT